MSLEGTSGHQVDEPDNPAKPAEGGGPAEGVPLEAGLTGERPFGPFDDPPPDPEAAAILARGVRPDGKPLTSLNRLLLSMSGRVTGWPPDMSVNHDHYLHGTAKREP